MSTVRATWRLAADIGLAIAVAAIVVAGSHVAQHIQRGRPLDGIGHVLLVMGAAALTARRARPVAVLVATAVAALAYYLPGYTGLFFPAIPLLVALYTTAAAGRRVQSLTVGAAVFVVFLFAKVLVPPATGPDIPGLLWITGFLTSALVLGEMSRSRRAYVAAMEQRALEAERTREEEARRRASEERLRIARELHDALGHSLSLINVQAGVAVHLLDKQPQHARTALVAIKQASKEALGELRGTLGALRQVDEKAALAPSPSLARLNELVAGASAVGPPVRVELSGTPRELPAGVDRAAYRIIQESLTNVARHAAADTVTVTVTYEPDELIVQVDDDGRGTSDGAGPDNGGGILGMRERARATGGELEAGPRPQGGFRVRARLPLDGSA